MKLLIIEEIPALRRLLRSVCDGLELSVSECNDGREALTACALEQPDWVLLDLSLSDTDALNAVRQINAAHPCARVLVVSGDDNLLLREAARSAGAFGYVLKENLMDVRQLLQTSPRNAMTY